MICAVCDTGPLLHLFEAQLLGTLHLIEEVYAPPQVVAELSYLLPDWQIPAWIHIGILDGTSALEASAWVQAELLHVGEAEAVALARQIRAHWLLTDDAVARVFAAEIGIEVHGSLGLILWGAVVGHFTQSEAEDAITRLSTTSLWLSGRVLSEARSALREIYQ